MNGNIIIKQRPDGYFIETTTKKCHYGQFYSNNPTKATYAKNAEDAVNRFIKFYGKFEESED